MVILALQQFDLDAAAVAVDRALAINPRLVLAHRVRADILMLSAGRPAAATILERARALNPADEGALGPLAAVYGSIDGQHDSGATRKGRGAEAERRSKTHSSPTRKTSAWRNRRARLAQRVSGRGAVHRHGRRLLQAVGIGRKYEARNGAAKALAVAPREQLTAFVMAQLYVEEGNQVRAREVLGWAFEAEHLLLDALVLFTKLLLEPGNYSEIERLATLGQERLPLDANWLAGITVADRETGQHDQLAAVLARCAEGDSDDLAMRVELAKPACPRLTAPLLRPPSAVPRARRRRAVRGERVFA